MRTDFYFRYRLYRRLNVLIFMDTRGPLLFLTKHTELGLLLRVGRYGIIVPGVT